MRHASQIAKETNEYKLGYKILAKGQGSIENVQEQTPSDCERAIGMSQTDFAQLVYRLENAVKTLEINSTEQAKTIKDVDKRLTSIETKIQFASWLRWGFISFCAVLWQFWDKIIYLVKKIP
jgi:hypothetical protein